MKTEPNDAVQRYIDSFDDLVSHRLLQVQACVRELVPEATEAMSYGLIGYKYNGKPLPLELISRVIQYRKETLS